MAKIIGGVAATGVPVPDWNQTNSKKADYIKNKPEVANALKGTASGNPIRIDDPSPILHEVKIETAVSEPLFKYGATCSPIPQKGTYTADEILNAAEDLGSMGVGNVNDEVYIVTGNGQYYIYGILAVQIKKGDTFYWDGQTALKQPAAETVTKESINLLTPEGREIINCIDTFPNLEENKIYLNITRNGYATPSYTNPPYVNVDECDFSDPRRMIVTTRQSGYGAGFTFKVNGGEVYTINMATSSKSSSVGYGFYKDGKTLISHGSVEGNQTLPRTVTVPNDAEMMILCLFGEASGTYKTFVFDDLQLERGTAASSYSPYFESSTHPVDENGKVSGITANGEAMTLIADNGATITAEWNRDINKAFQSLVNAILSTGGNV